MNPAGAAQPQHARPDATAPGEPVLILDFADRQLFHPTTIAPLFHGTGTVVVYDAEWRALRALRPSRWKWRAAGFAETLATRLRLLLAGSAHEVDPRARADFAIPATRPVVHVAPTLLAYSRRLFMTLLSPSSWRAVGDMRDGRFPHLRFAGVPIGGYVLDSFLRYRRPLFFFFGPRLPALARAVVWLAEYLAHADTATALAHRHGFGTIIINHAVYAESGMLAHVVRAMLGERVRVVHSNVSPGALHEMDRLAVCPYQERTRLFLAADARTDDVPQPMWQRLPAARSTGPGRGDRSIILAMHCLLDANDVHDDGRAVHPSFLEWIRHSIQVLAAAPDVRCILRLHPDRRWYGATEEAMYRHLFQDLPRNCRVLTPDDPEGHPTREGAVVVTFSGTIALELACLGRRAVAVGRPNCPVDCYVPIRSRQAYEEFLRYGFRNFDDRLTADAVAVANRYRQAMKRALDY